MLKYILILGLMAIVTSDATIHLCSQRLVDLGLAAAVDDRPLHCRMIVKDGDAITVEGGGPTGRHKLVRVLDLFADDLTEAQRKAADKLIESGECEDVLEAIERAREIIAEMERERAGRGVEHTNVDPFDVLAIPYRRDEFDRAATDGQLATLLRHGAVKGNPEKDREKMLAALREKFDRTSASLFIDVVVKRTAAHQSTIKQAMLLVSKGIPADVAKSMSFARASAAMTELAMSNWRPTPGWIEKYRQPEREVAA